MHELAGLSDKLVLVGVGCVFADSVELRFFFREAQVEDSPAVICPAHRPDGPSGNFQLSVLLAVEIDEPQGARLLPVEYLRAARPAHRVAHHPRNFSDSGGSPFRQSHQAKPRGVAPAFAEHRVESVIGDARALAALPVIRHAVNLPRTKLRKIHAFERRPVEVTEAALVGHERQRRAIERRGVGELQPLPGLQVDTEGLWGAGAVAPANEKLPFVREGAAIIRGQVSGVSRTAEAKYIQLGGRIGKTLQVRSEYRALAAFHRQTGSREECEERAARPTARPGREGTHKPMVTSAREGTL